MRLEPVRVDEPTRRVAIEDRADERGLGCVGGGRERAVKAVCFRERLVRRRRR
jgi:hypothetical protein